MVEAGIRSILNFAPAMLVVAEGVSVRKVDAAVELQIPATLRTEEGDARRRSASEVERWPTSAMGSYFALVISIRKTTARTITPNRMMKTGCSLVEEARSPLRASSFPFFLGLPTLEPYQAGALRGQERLPFLLRSIPERQMDQEQQERHRHEPITEYLGMLPES